MNEAIVWSPKHQVLQVWKSPSVCGVKIWYYDMPSDNMSVES